VSTEHRSIALLRENLAHLLLIRRAVGGSAGWAFAAPSCASAGDAPRASAMASVIVLNFMRFSSPHKSVTIFVNNYDNKIILASATEMVHPAANEIAERMVRMTRLARLLGMAVAWLAVPAAAQTLVQTQEGPVQGAQRDGVRVFTKIPFAAPPVGPLRFRPPQPVQPWTRPLVADGFIPNCIQFGGGNGAGPDEDTPQSEDCLYLSVWAPADASPDKPLPVMVWNFGGAFVVSGPSLYDGAQLARNGVVVVTLNYRLGLFGHMVDPSLDGPDGLSGNYDVRDVHAALQWVNRNIRKFGGDPGNVTIFGQSAGGLATMLQVVSPQSKGLFEKAIIESTHSGAATERPTIADRARTESTLGAKVVAAVGCTDAADRAACLRAAPVSAFTGAHTYIAHVQDAALLPADMHQALKTGDFNRVPMMIGNIAHEGAFYIIQDEQMMGHPLTEADLPKEAKAFFGDNADAMMTQYPAAKYGRFDLALVQAVTDYRLACTADSTRRAVEAWVPTYGYEMTQDDPEQRQPAPGTTHLPNLAHHASELNYVFGGGERDQGPFKTARAWALSAYFQKAWSNFAKFGSPGTHWPRFTTVTPAVMDIADKPAVTTTFADFHQCGFMRDKGMVKY
jgi:para-nitrobenzyl esterase